MKQSPLTPKVRRAFASVLKDARFESVLTQERLAEFAHLDRTTPSLLERALRQPTLTTIILVSRALLVDPRDLVGRVLNIIDAKDIVFTRPRTDAEIKRALGEVVRERRNERGLSQKDLSTDAGIDANAPTLLERGLRDVSFTKVIGIAGALHMSPPELVRRVMDRLIRMDKQRRRSRKSTRNHSRNIRKQ